MENLNTVTFRDFEERDIDFIYKCKNDEKLNSIIVGQWHPFTYEEAVKWVHGCMGDHETYKFWAICTIDYEKRIIGWISLAHIDKLNNSACFNGLVIADKDYRDGMAQIESYLFILDYAFEVLKVNRLYGSHLNIHKMTRAMARATFFFVEGEKRESVYKNYKYYNEFFVSILSREYYEHKDKGEYTVNSVLKRLLKELKQFNE